MRICVVFVVVCQGRLPFVYMQWLRAGPLQILYLLWTYENSQIKTLVLDPAVAAKKVHRTSRNNVPHRWILAE